MCAMDREPTCQLCGPVDLVLQKPRNTSFRALYAVHAAGEHGTGGNLTPVTVHNLVSSCRHGHETFRGSSKHMHARPRKHKPVGSNDHIHGCKTIWAQRLQVQRESLGQPLEKPV